MKYTYAIAVSLVAVAIAAGFIVKRVFCQVADCVSDSNCAVGQKCSTGGKCAWN